MNFFSQNVDLAFEVIVQPPKHTFEIEIFSRFSSLCKEREEIERERRKLEQLEKEKKELEKELKKK